MLVPRRVFDFVLCACALGSTSAFASAQSSQCEPQWIPTFGQGFWPSGFSTPLQVHDAVEFDDGSGSALYIAGEFPFLCARTVTNVSRWKDGVWEALGNGLPGLVRDLHVHDDGTGPKLYAAGNFSSNLGAVHRRVARWTGTSWVKVGLGFEGPVHRLATYDNGSGPALCAAGSFLASGTKQVLRVARWDGSEWMPLGTGLGPATGTSIVVTDLDVFDAGDGPQLFASGSFVAAGSTPALRVARWNGVEWASVGAGFDGTVNTLEAFDDGSGRALYAGGMFTNSGSTSVRRLARWSGGSWSEFGGGITNGSVTALHAGPVDGLPSLVIGGPFTTTGSGPTSQVAAWRDGQFHALGRGLSQGFVFGFQTLDLEDNHGILALGTFLASGPSPLQRAAVFEAGSTAAGRPCSSVGISKASAACAYGTSRSGTASRGTRSALASKSAASMLSWSMMTDPALRSLLVAVSPHSGAPSLRWRSGMARTGTDCRC
jgi:hypothetical protein